MTETSTPPNDAKEVFKQCGTCSQTFAHLLDREFGHPMLVEEQALTRLAGGIMNKGHQCGMLWGATLAVGAEAARRHDTREDAVAAAVVATQHVVESFRERTHTVNCREITGRKLDSVLGLVKFAFDTMRAGMDQSPCFVLAEQWAPEAIQSAGEGLAEAPPEHELQHPPRSCASALVDKMGGSEEQAVMVAGFAGGLGLGGNACGALAAALWMHGLAWQEAHPNKRPGLRASAEDKRTLKVFSEATEGEFLCAKICGRRFEGLDEHSAYLEAGGCAELIDALASA